MSRATQVLLCIVLAAAAMPEVSGYESGTHQSLTFNAAKRFNRCVEGMEIPQLTALQVRNLVRGNLREGELGVRRWGYYDRSGAKSRRLLWFIETRLHSRYDVTIAKMLEEAADVRESDRYRALGVLLHYLQNMTVPADVVPIFHPRLWRWPAGDRFTGYEIEEEFLESYLGDMCEDLWHLTPTAVDFKELLKQTAMATMAAIRDPIADMNATWQVFWKEDKPGRFGSYGPAGNSFGRGARFRCGKERCLLLNDDPIYRDFAAHQQRLAVLVTMRAVLILQRFRMAHGASALRAVELNPAAPAQESEVAGG